ncbi:MAG: 3'-to-5' oligoribonuclease B [Campylobacteraceae bacterium]|nr:3'-to-5' oligoribonuclease B [Campylobacteraceae bacterium]
MKYNIFHLSHTDLDGYGCQFVVKNYFKNVKFYNSNYGKEMDERYAKILEDIKILNAKLNIILITDLNLTSEQAKNFEEKIGFNKNIKLMLFDHHQSGQETAERNSWYILDTKRCATKITYDFFSSIYGKNDNLSKLVNIINAVDIWQSNDSNFELGKVCLGMIANAKELNRIMFDEANIQFMFSLLEQSCKFFDKKEPHILLEDNIHAMKKNFFKANENNTLSNLVSKYNVKLLNKMRDKMTITYKGHKGILTFNIGSASAIGNDFLTANNDYDFFMDVTSRKTVSFRANGKVDVSKIAAELANGGGHPNASGGALSNFRDSFSYDIVKNQIVELIKSKEGKA